MEKASKRFETSSVLLHLGFSLTHWQEQNRAPQVPKCHERCAKAGRLIRRSRSLFLNRHKRDKHAQWGFTRVRAMAEAQPARCFLDYHTVITKLIKKLREIVWQSRMGWHQYTLPFLCHLRRAHNSLGAT